MTETTVIQSADWAIVWDRAAGRHGYRRDVDVVFKGGDIVLSARTIRAPLIG